MKSFIDVISFTRIEKSKDSLLKQLNINENTFSDERIREFYLFSQNIDLKNILIKSFAPSIFESDIVKYGLLCQLFGGVEKSFTNSKNSTNFGKRGEINILLCGDPSTGKSQLLKYVNSISSRGV